MLIMLKWTDYVTLFSGFGGKDERRGQVSGKSYAVVSSNSKHSATTVESGFASDPLLRITEVQQFKAEVDIFFLFFLFLHLKKNQLYVQQ